MQAVGNAVFGVPGAAGPARNGTESVPYRGLVVFKGHAQ
jgi:hypothetical protein